MSIFIALFMGIAVNLDNFVIGMQLGIQNKPILLRTNLIISSISGILAGLAAFGPRIFPQVMITAANIIGALIILLFGLLCLLKKSDSKSTREGVPPVPGRPQGEGLSLKGTCALGFTLAINCIPPAIGAGILHISALYIGFFCGICSFLCMYISSRLGQKLNHCSFVRHLDHISALLLICIGIIELTSI